MRASPTRTDEQTTKKKKKNVKVIFLQRGYELWSPRFQGVKQKKGWLCLRYGLTRDSNIRQKWSGVNHLPTNRTTRRIYQTSKTNSSHYYLPNSACMLTQFSSHQNSSHPNWTGRSRDTCICENPLRRSLLKLEDIMVRAGLGLYMHAFRLDIDGSESRLGTLAKNCESWRMVM